VDFGLRNWSETSYEPRDRTRRYKVGTRKSRLGDEGWHLSGLGIVREKPLVKRTWGRKLNYLRCGPRRNLWARPGRGKRSGKKRARCYKAVAYQGRVKRGSQSGEWTHHNDQGLIIGGGKSHPVMGNGAARGCDTHTLQWLPDTRPSGQKEIQEGNMADSYCPSSRDWKGSHTSTIGNHLRRDAAT